MQRSTVLLLLAAIIIGGVSGFIANRALRPLTPSAPIVREGPPLYPFWTRKDLPDPAYVGPVLVKPTAYGVYISKGYLLAPTYGMGIVAEDMGSDPTVHVLDGKEWREGKYVDFDEDLEIAIIRVDVSGRPVTVATSEGVGTSVVSMHMLSTGEFVPVTTHLQQCDARTLNVPTGWTVIGRWQCAAEDTRDSSGGLFLDASGNFVGVSTSGPDSRKMEGPGLELLRRRIAQYNKSWGTHAQPQPHL